MAKSRASVRYKSEEKRRHALIIAIILLLLGVIMIIYGTYAYYQTAQSGTVTGSVAIWTFKANSSASSFNITLAPSQTNVTANSTMAPGTSGSFDIKLSTKANGISADYTITFSNFSNIPANLKFYSDSNYSTETDITASGFKITGTLAANSEVTKTIYWKWPLGNESSITADNAAADKNVSFTATVVGKQHQ